MENIINLTKMSFNNLTSIFKNIGIILLIWLVIAIINPSFLSMLFAMGGYLLLYQIMAYEDMYKIDNLSICGSSPNIPTIPIGNPTISINIIKTINLPFVTPNLITIGIIEDIEITEEITPIKM